MSGKPFLDTNVVLNLLSEDTVKADRAEALLAAVSVQVLNETVSVMTRKLKMNLDEIREVLAGVRHYCTVEPLTAEIHDKALDVMGRHGFSVYDSLIIAAAIWAGCDTLYSEDLQDGFRASAALTIVNPFT